jgi:sugar phosphate isomerase/epimerase
MGNSLFAEAKFILFNYIASTRACQRKGLLPMKEILKKLHVNIPFVMLYESYLPRFIQMRINPEIGFDAVALDQYDLEQSRRVASELHGQDLSINLHGPFMDLSPGSPDPSIRKLTRQRFDRMIRLAAIYKAERVIFHAGYERRRYGYMQEQWAETAGETFLGLWRGLEQEGSILILENVFEEGPEDLLPLLGALKTAGFCLDTGHQAAFSSTPQDRWIETLWPYLRQLHLHDNRGEKDEHLAMGQGEIDFQSLFKDLRLKMEKPPAITLEPHRESDLWPSVEYLEKVWPWES